MRGPGGERALRVGLSWRGKRETTDKHRTLQLAIRFDPLIHHTPEVEPAFLGMDTTASESELALGITRPASTCKRTRRHWTEPGFGVPMKTAYKADMGHDLEDMKRCVERILAYSPSNSDRTCIIARENGVTSFCVVRWGNQVTCPFRGGDLPGTYSSCAASYASFDCEKIPFVERRLAA